MKLFLSIFFGIVLMASIVNAAGEFIVCDPYSADQAVTKFVGIVNGTPFETAYSLHADGKAIIYGPLETDGIYDFTEIKAENIRGQSAPVPFLVPALPPGLTGLNILSIND